MSLLIGTVSPPNESPPANGDYVLMLRFQAVASGNITKIKFKAGENGTIKVAVYADNSGEPGALLNAVNTATSVTADTESVITIASTPVTSGTYYWLAFSEDAGQRYYYTGSGYGTRRYKAITYSGYSFPDPAGSGYTGDTYDVYIAGESEPVITSADNGAGGESAAFLEKEIFSGESGSSADIGGIAIDKISGDSGSGNEVGGLLKSFSGDDIGRGTDITKLLLQKNGSDLKLQNTRGQLGLPNKEIRL
jgi:hypothetical protein